MMLNYYGIDTIPLHDDRVAAILLSIVNQVSDSQILTFDHCQGFTELNSSSGLDGLRLQGLKEYSDSYLISDYLRPVFGSKCLIMQTMGNYLRLSWTWNTLKRMFQVATWTSNLLYYFPYMYIHWSHFSD
jgi:hypothetical protein